MSRESSNSHRFDLQFLVQLIVENVFKKAYTYISNSQQQQQQQQNVTISVKIFQFRFIGGSDLSRESDLSEGSIYQRVPFIGAFEFPGV